MNVRLARVALPFVIVAFSLPTSAGAAPEVDYNYGPERSATPSQPKMDVDSFDGSFNYEYPLKLPPGRNGVEPALSLMYSSKNTEQIGPFGYGWSVNIPYIERSNERGTNNLYSTTTNLFSSLDGELRATSTATTTEFGALNDDGSFRKYEFINQSYWRVTDKSGTQYTFGTSSLSQLVDNASSTRIFRWMLEKVQDKNGNYVKYEYQKDNNQIYPYKVKYTGNGSTDGIYEIEFLRENRSDIATSSRTGFEVVSKQRITEVAVREGSNFLKSYKLSYGTGDNSLRSLLTSLVEAGRSESGATSTMPTTTLAYSIPTEGWTLNSSWIMPEYFINDTGSIPDEAEMGVRFDDFNGDGLVDALQARTDEVGTIYINKGDGSWSTTTPSGVKPVTSLTEGINARVADIDGDGLADFVNGLASSTMNTNRGGGFTPDTTWLSDIGYTATSSGIYYDVGGRILDLNGDGLVDLAAAYSSTTDATLEAANGVYLNNGAGWDATSTNAWTLPSGKHFAAGLGSTIGRDMGARFADFNADGLTDILFNYDDGTPPYSYIYFNDGDGTWTEAIPGGDLATSTALFDAEAWRIVDVNSDGLADLVNTRGSSGFTVYKNRDGGRTFERDASWGTIPVDFQCTVSMGCSLVDDVGGRFIDINGDGIVDVVRSDATEDHGATVNATYLGNATAPADMLTSIASNSIGSTTIAYKSTAEYVDSTGRELNPRLPINFQTVATITKHNLISGGAIGTTTYSYEGGEYYYANEFDRKFAGFATTTITDPFGNVTKTFSSQGNGTQTAIGEANDDRSMIGKPYRVEVYSGTSTLMKKTITKWENVSLSNGRKFVLNTRELEMDYDGDSDHRDKGTTYEYDSNNGNLLTVTEYGEVTGSDDGTFASGLGATNSHVLDLETDSDQYVYITDGSQTGLDITGDFTVSGWVNLETSPDFPGDEYGFVSKYDTGQASQAYVTSLVQDGPSGMTYYVTAQDNTDTETAHISNGGGLTQSTWYMVTIVKSGTTATAYLNATSKGSDTTNASQRDSVSSFGIGISNFPATYSTLDGKIDEVGIWSRALSGSEVTELYNSASGQTYDTMTSGLKTGLQGYWGFNNAYSDASGNGNTLTTSGSPTFSTSVPFEALANAGFDRKTVYTYVASSTASNVSFLKGGTVLDGNSATSSERRLYYDNLALGSLGKGDLTKEERWASSTAYLGTQWAYSSLGLVTTETDPRGKQTTFSYNNNLFVATTTNPVGHVTEFYRDMSSGKVKKRVDPNGLSWETTYDGLDRPTEEKIPDHLGTPSSTVTAKLYEYTDTPGNRSVKETTYLNGATTTEKYTYLDGFERKIQERSEGESSFMAKDWEYDARGQVGRESLSYFSTGASRTSFTALPGLIVSYGYDALGRLATTTNVRGTATTTYDQWTEQVTDRNGEIKRYVYDAFKNLTAVGELTSTTTATTTYAYDTLNNLATTTDAHGNVRTFTYDGLLRLRSATDLHATNDTSYGTRLYEYDASGNISSTTDAKGQNVLFSYDDINRVLTENYAGQAGTEIQYAYDVCTNGKGRLCAATTTEAVTNLQYDALGNIATSTRIINSATSTMVYAYDRAKNPTSMLYPNGIRAYYEYNTAGLLERLWTQTGTTSAMTVIASSTSYTATAQAAQRILGNGLTTAYTFNDSDLYRLTNILTVAATSSTIVDANTHSTDLEKSSSQSFYITDANAGGLLDDAADMSWAFWVKLESEPADDGGWYTLVNKDNAAGTRSYEIYYVLNAGGACGHDCIKLYVFGASNYTYSVQQTLTPGTWYHIAVTFDSGTAKIYVNGSENTTNAASSGSQASIQNGDGDFCIGGHSYDISGAGCRSAIRYWYDGLVDDVRVWERALSSGDVASLYSNPTSFTNGSNFSGWWKFNNNSNDSSGNSNTLTGNNSPTYSTTVPYAGEESITSTTTQTQNFTYTYDNVGNIITVTDNSGGGTGHAISYSYDDYHRLTQATTTAASSSPYRHTFAYDSLGNIIQMNIGGATSTYAYSTTTYANPHAATTINGVTYMYDNNGNLTAIGTGIGSTAYTWDWRDRLTQTATGTATTTYGYDHENTRVRRTVKSQSGTATTTFVNSYFNYNSSGTTTAHILLPDGTPVATVEANGTATSTYWLHLDHLGGIHSVTNASGAPVETTDYYPFGDSRIASSSSAYSEQRKFIGENFDSDSDLSYLNARYYDGDAAKFLSQDPVFLSIADVGGLERVTQQKQMLFLRDPQQLNSYSYAGNNPLVNKDPTGKEYDKVNYSFTVPVYAGVNVGPTVGVYRTPEGALVSIGGAWSPVPGPSVSLTTSAGNASPGWGVGSSLYAPVAGNPIPIGGEVGYSRNSDGTWQPYSEAGIGTQGFEANVSYTFDPRKILDDLGGPIREVSTPMIFSQSGSSGSSNNYSFYSYYASTNSPIPQGRGGGTGASGGSGRVGNQTGLFLGTYDFGPGVGVYNFGTQSWVSSPSKSSKSK